MTRRRKFSRKRNAALSGNGKFSARVVSIAIFGFVFCFFVILFFIHDMPDLDRLESKGRRASIVFESYDGKTIATYGDLSEMLLVLMRFLSMFQMRLLQ